jgi:hypothetical protein
LHFLPGVSATTGRSISPTVRRLVELMDQRYRVPGTSFRFGVDAILGLVPGFGDFLGMLIGSVVFFEAVRLRLPLSVLARMLLNLLLDSAIGSLPVVGDAFDFVFKANRRNLRLLERYA